jgi:hypothetical protein
LQASALKSYLYGLSSEKLGHLPPEKMFVFATTFKLLELGYVQGEQIGPNVAIFWLLFTGLGKFWVRIWFVVSTYRTQKGVM